MRPVPAVLATGVVAGGSYWTFASSQSQLLGAFPNRCDTGRRVVALTFDDGPNEPYTSRLAEILHTRGVRGTFFQVGRAVERDPDTSRGLLAAGHVLGNHSYSHRLPRSFREEDVAGEIGRTQDLFGELLGYWPRFYRPPWLLRTPGTFRALRRFGLRAVSGTFCHPFEVATAAGPRIAARALARLSPGRMIIFHDGYNGTGADRSRTLDAVARTIDTAAERGWSFVTVAELLDQPGSSSATISAAGSERACR